MNVLLVYAHPEPISLNGSLRDFSVQRLQAAGHAVQVSDLYAMNWKARLDAGDAPQRDAMRRNRSTLRSTRKSLTPKAIKPPTSLANRKSCCGPTR